MASLFLFLVPTVDAGAQTDTRKFISIKFSLIFNIV